MWKGQECPSGNNGQTRSTGSGQAGMSTPLSAGNEEFKRVVPRSIGQSQCMLAERGDPDLIFSASKTVRIE
jgi:hypothetical protein